VKNRGWTDLAIQRLAFPLSCLKAHYFLEIAQWVLTFIKGLAPTLKLAGPIVLSEATRTPVTTK
jgi:hypothetical protein